MMTKGQTNKENELNQRMYLYERTQFNFTCNKASTAAPIEGDTNSI